MAVLGGVWRSMIRSAAEDGGTLDELACHIRALMVCFVCATAVTGPFSDAGLACFLGILVTDVMLPDLPGLLVAQGSR